MLVPQSKDMIFETEENLKSWKFWIKFFHKEHFLCVNSQQIYRRFLMMDTEDNDVFGKCHIESNLI